MYLPPANFQQFTINDYDSVTVLVMTFFTVGFQPEGPLNCHTISYSIGDIFYFITCLLEFVMIFFRENSVLVLVRVKGYKFASVFVW